MAAYAASKAGAEAFGDSLRPEVKHLGVDVGVGYFSFIDTDMVRGADAHPADRRSAARDVTRPDRRRPTRSPTPARPSPTASRSAAAGSWCRPGRAPCSCCAPRWRRSRSAAAGDFAAEADRLFEADVEERGAEAASKPVGPGGQAAAPGGDAGGADPVAQVRLGVARRHQVGTVAERGALAARGASAAGVRRRRRGCSGGSRRRARRPRARAADPAPRRGATSGSGSCRARRSAAARASGSRRVGRRRPVRLRRQRQSVGAKTGEEAGLEPAEGDRSLTLQDPSAAVLRRARSAARSSTTATSAGVVP